MDCVNFALLCGGCRVGVETWIKRPRLWVAGGLDGFLMLWRLYEWCQDFLVGTADGMARRLVVQDGLCCAGGMCVVLRGVVRADVASVACRCEKLVVGVVFRAGEVCPVCGVADSG